MKNDENRKKLNAILKEICDIEDYEKDFILGTNACLKTDDQVKEMLDWLEKHKDSGLDTDEVTVKSLEIRHSRKLEVNGVAARD